MPDEYHLSAWNEWGSGAGSIEGAGLGFSSTTAGETFGIGVGVTYYGGTVAGHRRVTALDLERDHDRELARSDPASPAISVTVGDRSVPDMPDEPDSVQVGPINVERPGGVPDWAWGVFVLIVLLGVVLGAGKRLLPDATKP